MKKIIFTLLLFIVGNVFVPKPPSIGPSHLWESERVYGMGCFKCGGIIVQFGEPVYFNGETFSTEVKIEEPSCEDHNLLEKILKNHGCACSEKMELKGNWFYFIYEKLEDVWP